MKKYKRNPTEKILMGLLSLAEGGKMHKSPYQFEINRKKTTNNAIKQINLGISEFADAEKRKRVHSKLKLLTKEKFGVDLI
jgi:hypothetical protein